MCVLQLKSQGWSPWKVTDFARREATRRAMTPTEASVLVSPQVMEVLHVEEETQAQQTWAQEHDQRKLRQKQARQKTAAAAKEKKKAEYNESNRKKEQARMN
jgi:hypothetical protein